MIKNDIKNNKNDIIFQVIDWDYYHEEDFDEEGSISKFKIRLYGTTNDNKKIFMRVDDFTPYFFTEIPEKWSKQLILVFLDEIKKKLPVVLKNSLKTWDVVRRHKFYGFTNYKKYTFLRLIFYSYDGMKAYEKILRRPIYNRILGNKSRKYDLFESNIEPFLRCMHIRKIESCGWIKINGGRYNFFPEEDSPTLNELNIYSSWVNLNPVEEKNIVSLIIASFDIECTSGDGNFPQAERDSDKIIQIGTTFSKYGESECYFKHIITLKSCDPIQGVTVESYDDEQDVLLAWTKLIQTTNPDIMIGYNIFGFDYKYMEMRAKKLGILNAFSKLSRVKNISCRFLEKTLSSSALGENILKYFETNGRVLIDLMKVIMRDYKLSSYKLDNVAAEFIKEDIIRLEFDNENDRTVIFTKSTYGLDIDRYIKIFYNDGLSDNSYRNDTKFKIIGLTNNSITIGTILDNEAIELSKYKVFWSQAKDDVQAKDIFRLQEGSSSDRAIIAKYCVMDCILCNRLIAKLQILTNNISMANVCHVPLSYIFLRGQGIKIFSLVAKKCRERDHIIPVLKKPFIQKEDPKDTNKIKKKKISLLDMEIRKLNGDFIDAMAEEEGYEGATVFNPDVGVHFEPITVLDYNSLYPSSMIHRNLSHECILLDQQYDNLKGFEYKNVTFYNNDGTTKKCRFAQEINGRIGILPEILKYLLDQRKLTRKLMEDEIDIFKKKIWDSLQNAYKITANSLYGQCGSKYSNIYMRDIAASTCATGREMLNAAKIFTEIILPILVKAVQEESFDSFYTKINLFFDRKIDELIGENNINKLKEIVTEVIKRQDQEIIRKEAKYQYLRVFYENLSYDESKFIDIKLGLKGKEDFINWIYYEINNLLNSTTISPKIIYGDSIHSSECLMLLNDKNQIEFKTIGSLCDNWEQYNNFKTCEYNGYFINLVKILFKTKKQIKNIKKDKTNLVPIEDFNNGKYVGSINEKIYNNEIKYKLKINVNKNDKIKKLFNTKFEANEFKKIINKKHNLIKNQLRKIFDTNKNEYYLEVKLTENKIMICDLEDYDIVKNYIWYTSLNKKNYYALTIYHKQFHYLVMRKLVDKLPFIIKKKINNLTVNHINGNTLDNRKCNLRLLTAKEYQWNKKGYTKLCNLKKEKKWYFRYKNFLNNKSSFKYFEKKEDAIIESKKLIKKSLNYFDNENMKLIIELKKLLIEDQKNRYLKEQAKTNYKIWTDKGWKIINRVIRHKTNKKIYRTITKTSLCDVTEDHSLIDNDGNYLKPKDCHTGTKLLCGFPDEFDETINFKPNMEIFTSSDKIECQKYYYTQKKLGYNLLIDYNDNKFILSRTKEQIRNPNEIVKIVQLDDDKDRYVYDLETISGRFHCGIGELIVKNTDSIFTKLFFRDIKTGKQLSDQKSLELSIKFGPLTSKLLATVLPSPQNMGYEKIFHPFIILTKKRYVGNKYENDPNKYYQSAMGIQLKRRDNAPIVKIVVGGIVKKILNDRSAAKAVEFTKETLRKILTGKYQIDKFILSKTLKGSAYRVDLRNYLLKKNKFDNLKIIKIFNDVYAKEDLLKILCETFKKDEQYIINVVNTDGYKDRSRIVHAVLADRMAERDPGNKPQSNDRIPYVYVVIDKEVKLQGDMVETPDYIIENNLQIDYLFYIVHQIMKPAKQFLSHMVIQPEKIFENVIIREQNRRGGKKPLSYFFSQDIYKSENDSYDTDSDKIQIDIDTSTINSDKIIQFKKKIKKKLNPKKNIKNKTEYNESRGGYVIDL
ncbi:DNA polymerase family B [uncultured virus]|nr:DNA polymerase family B [uncultured virus]